MEVREHGKKCMSFLDSSNVKVLEASLIASKSSRRPQRWRDLCTKYRCRCENCTSRHKKVPRLNSDDSKFDSIIASEGNQNANGQSLTLPDKSASLSLVIAAFEVAASSLPLTQMDFHRLACVNKAINRCIVRHCFGGSPGSRLFVDFNGHVQPINAPIVHRSLLPLVLHGFLSAEKAVQYACLDGSISPKVNCSGDHQRNEHSSEMSNRYQAVRATGKLSSAQLLQLEEYLKLRTRSKLNEMLSSPCIWALALGLIKFDALDRVSSRTQALFGIRETQYKVYSDSSDSSESQPSCEGCVRNGHGFCRYYGLCQGHVVVSYRNKLTRSLRKQWDICRWLYDEVKLKRNKNVKAFLRFCLPSSSASSFKISEPSCEFVRLFVESKSAREALSSSLVTFSQMLRIFHESGIGHLEHILSDNGLALLRARKLSVSQTMLVSSSKLLQAYINYSDMLDFEALLKMQAKNRWECEEMVRLILRYRLSFSDKAVLNKLLNLPSLECLKFALSPVGQDAIRKNMLELDRDFSPFVSFSAKNGDVLTNFFRSSAACALLQQGLLTVSDIVECIENNHVLSALLSPTGIDGLSRGTFKIRWLKNIHSGKKALKIVHGHAVNENSVSNQQKKLGGLVPERTVKESHLKAQPELLILASKSPKCRTGNAAFAPENLTHMAVTSLSRSERPRSGYDSDLSMIDEGDPSDLNKIAKEGNQKMSKPHQHVEDDTEEATAHPVIDDEPTSERLAKLLAYLDFTAVENEKDAVAMLSMCGWDVQAAIATFLAVK